MTDAASGRRTRERETVKTTVETTEIVEFQCANCQQWFGGDEMVGIGVGPRDATNRQPEQSQLCTLCAETIFDYDGVAGLESRTTTRESTDRSDGWDFPNLTPIAITLSVIGIVGTIGYTVTEETAAQMAAEAQEPVELGAPFATEAAGLIPLVLFVILGATIFHAPRVMGRRYE